MFDWLWWLLDVTPFKKPYECGGWTDLLVHSTVVSNFAIFAVYTAIPVLLVAFFSQRAELAFIVRRRLIYLFAVFIFSCGVTHLLRGLSFYWPAYRLQVVVNVETAIVSWLAVIVMSIAAIRHGKDAVLQELETLNEEVKALREVVAELKRIASTGSESSGEALDA